MTETIDPLTFVMPPKNLKAYYKRSVLNNWTAVVSALIGIVLLYMTLAHEHGFLPVLLMGSGFILLGLVSGVLLPYLQMRQGTQTSLSNSGITINQGIKRRSYAWGEFKSWASSLQPPPLTVGTYLQNKMSGAGDQAPEIQDKNSPTICFALAYAKTRPWTHVDNQLMLYVPRELTAKVEGFLNAHIGISERAKAMPVSPKAAHKAIIVTIVLLAISILFPIIYFLFFSK